MSETEDDKEAWTRLSEEGRHKVRLKNGAETDVGSALAFTEILRDWQETAPQLVEGLATLARDAAADVPADVLAELKRTGLVWKDGGMSPELRNVVLAAYVEAGNQEGKIVRDPIAHPDREHAARLEEHERKGDELARRLIFGEGDRDSRDDEKGRTR